ncbi:MAG: hypothetical protein ACPGU1_10350 [Myxococcota bacterium]
MNDQRCDAWRGLVKGGEMTGYRLEVRRQRFPWTLYILAFTAPDDSEEPVVVFALGRLKLAEHLHRLEAEVTWEDGRGPLAPERDFGHLKVVREEKGPWPSVRARLPIPKRSSTTPPPHPKRTRQARRSSLR